MAETKETFDITGMTCAACSARVGKAAGACAGVTEAMAVRTPWRTKPTCSLQ